MIKITKGYKIMLITAFIIIAGIAAFFILSKGAGNQKPERGVFVFEERIIDNVNEIYSGRIWKICRTKIP